MKILEFCLTRSRSRLLFQWSNGQRRAIEVHPFPLSFLPSALKLLITLLYNAREGVSGETLIRPFSVGAVVQRIPRFADNVTPSSSYVLLGW